MDLDHERDRILGQKVRPAQRARMSVSRAHELQLDSQQWQYLVWTFPVDVLDAIAQIRRGATRGALCLIVLWLMHFHVSGQDRNSNAFGAGRKYVHPCCA